MARPSLPTPKQYALVTPPAFFGESQLFIGDPEPSQYSARCKTRAEFVILGTADVLFVISELPYIRPRFQEFADGVKAKWFRHDEPRSPYSPASPYSPSSPVAPPAGQAAAAAAGKAKGRAAGGALAAPPAAEPDGQRTASAGPAQGRHSGPRGTAPGRHPGLPPEVEPFDDNFDATDEEEEEERTADEILRSNSKDFLLGGPESMAQSEKSETPDLFPSFRAIFGNSDPANGDGAGPPGAAPYDKPTLARTKSEVPDSSTARGRAAQVHEALNSFRESPPGAARGRAAQRPGGRAGGGAGNRQISPLVTGGASGFSSIRPDGQRRGEQF